MRFQRDRWRSSVGVEMVSTCACGDCECSVDVAVNFYNVVTIVAPLVVTVVRVFLLSYERSVPARPVVSSPGSRT
jgi:hypothetical protein